MEGVPVIIHLQVALRRSDSKFGRTRPLEACYWLPNTDVQVYRSVHSRVPQNHVVALIRRDGKDIAVWVPSQPATNSTKKYQMMIIIKSNNDDDNKVNRVRKHNPLAGVNLMMI